MYPLGIPKFYPTFVFGSALCILYYNHTPTAIIPDTPDPRSFNQMRGYPDEKPWKTAHDHEIKQLNDKNVIQWIRNDQNPPDIAKLKPISPTMKSCYKHNPGGSVTRMELCEVRGDMMKPSLH